MKTDEYKNIDRSESYAVQHTVTLQSMTAFVQGTARTVELPICDDKLSVGLIEFTKDYAMTTFKRSDLYAGLAACAQNAIDDGNSSCSNLPSKAGKAGAMTLLTTKYTTQARGDRPSRTVNAMMQGLGAHRRANKTRAKHTALALALKENRAYIAEGVNVKDGTARTFENRELAAKAWVRANHPLKGDWWTDRANKGSWLHKGEAHVSLLTD